MKHVEVSKLWGMVNRIDTIEKVFIADKFLRECDLSNEDYDDLMIAVSQQYRFLREIENDKNLKPEYRKYS